MAADIIAGSEDRQDCHAIAQALGDISIIGVVAAEMASGGGWPGGSGVGCPEAQGVKLTGPASGPKRAAAGSEGEADGGPVRIGVEKAAPCRPGKQMRDDGRRAGGKTAESRLAFRRRAGAGALNGLPRRMSGTGGLGVRRHSSAEAEVQTEILASDIRQMKGFALRLKGLGFRLPEPPGSCGCPRPLTPGGCGQPVAAPEEARKDPCARTAPGGEIRPWPTDALSAGPTRGRIPCSLFPSSDFALKRYVRELFLFPGPTLHSIIRSINPQLMPLILLAASSNILAFSRHQGPTGLSAGGGSAIPHLPI
jgi:hypothetical protein